ncbi:hypothetical protein H112_05355 [Trichophyton rubrum D6]|uniref:Uncharacterized protein n=2 Tax=Trichophyton rubrum TaxID=5551 RepID=A0A080WFJ9_TRIRC|nr:uncharacterized protein TERG_11949 [Trichophyton rubrum CBS 118892]EZF19047.1 hypothetical protein H100_05374 [Trichophyton rubrum MR850]EZF40711.1 hypothetical protein H102_05339 [Trichophyton rubrum CBS 100081]EZF51341.1 hypothetical protein H103_05364 [Trichophyton rubrum CBS 288.86]EZF61928.1 hypothetical protein H104_05355 [Trichophyton rubrum CBS 289.86]EZF83247.1 hypothetical protein H110_05361 [Trichophyton rubrum MR1448]EZF93955.1 hypothetical protein H113_05400 [Trichophyton rubr
MLVRMLNWFICPSKWPPDNFSLNAFTDLYTPETKYHTFFSSIKSSYYYLIDTLARVYCGREEFTNLLHLHTEAAANYMNSISTCPNQQSSVALLKTMAFNEILRAIRA